MPARDAVEEPRICEPAALADGVMDVIASAERFSRMSHAAIDRVAARFDFDDHVDDVMAAVREYHATGTLEHRP
jgi:hypothetical protein